MLKCEGGGGVRRHPCRVQHQLGDVGAGLAVPHRGYLGRRLLQPDQVHLNAEILHQQLARHPPHGVERVVRVWVCLSRK